MTHNSSCDTSFKASDWEKVKMNSASFVVRDYIYIICQECDLELVSKSFCTLVGPDLCCDTSFKASDCEEVKTE